MSVTYTLWLPGSMVRLSGSDPTGWPRTAPLYGLIPRAQCRQLELHSPGQLHSSPVFGVEFTPLNTHRAPFDDVRVRWAKRSTARSPMQPWVTYATENDVDLVSKRLRNYEYNPVWGILVDQAWLH